MEVVCNCPSKDTSQISPCNHEEADTHIMLHVKDTVQTGMRQIMIRTVDTDVVVIAISIVHKLNILNMKPLPIWDLPNPVHFFLPCL